MKYSLEFKLKCIDAYKSGKKIEVPKGVQAKRFQKEIVCWMKLYEKHGTDGLKHKGRNREWTPEEKLVWINKCLAGQSINTVAIEAGINSGLLYTWVRKYKELGYNGLSIKPGRKPKGEPDMAKKKVQPAELTESEREELIRLREENAFLKAQAEIIKKRIALRHAKEEERLKAKRQRSSKTSEKKDTN